jgi:hypothetical protein
MKVYRHAQFKTRTNVYWLTNVWTHARLSESKAIPDGDKYTQLRCWFSGYVLTC